MSNILNYSEQGGDDWVVGGKLTITGTLTVAEGASVSGVITEIPLATESAAGAVKVAANQAASTESTTPTVAEFNALLASLKAAGIMTADE